jgi:hypothetical protein
MYVSVYQYYKLCIDFVLFYFLNKFSAIELSTSYLWLVKSVCYDCVTYGYLLSQLETPGTLTIPRRCFGSLVGGK